MDRNVSIRLSDEQAGWLDAIVASFNEEGREIGVTVTASDVLRVALQRLYVTEIENPEGSR